MQKDGGTSISKYTQEDVKSLKRERKMGIYHINIYTGFGMCVCRLVHVNAKNKKKKQKTKRIQRERERERILFFTLFCGLRPKAQILLLPSFLTYLRTRKLFSLSLSAILPLCTRYAYCTFEIEVEEGSVGIFFRIKKKNKNK